MTLYITPLYQTGTGGQYYVRNVTSSSSVLHHLRLHLTSSSTVDVRVAFTFDPDVEAGLNQIVDVTDEINTTITRLGRAVDALSGQLDQISINTEDLVLHNNRINPAPAPSLAAYVIEGERRAWRTLYEHLNDAQKLQLLINGWFDVVGSRTASIYRISCLRRQHNIYRMTGRGVLDREYCVHIHSNYPLGDNFLAQKLALELEEHHVLDTANSRLVEITVENHRLDWEVSYDRLTRGLSEILVDV